MIRTNALVTSGFSGDLVAFTTVAPTTVALLGPNRVATQGQPTRSRRGRTS